MAKHFQESAGAQVRIIGFPDQNNSHSSAEDLDWEHEGVEVQELRRGRREDLLLRWVPFLKKRRATLPLAIACYEWAYSRQISRLCRGSSVFHYFGTGMEMNGYAIADAAKKIQAKFVIEPAIHAGTWGDTWLDAKLYMKADLLLAHTTYEAGILQNFNIPENRISTIVHGMDFIVSGCGSHFRAQHGVEGPLVLFLGRKTTKKGVGLLLDAWPSVFEKFPNASLAFVGSKVWKDESLLRFRQQRSNQLKIIDLDDVSEQEKQNALAACNILCVPSEGESFGMVFYEAWAYKKPVVALDLPVLRETIGFPVGGLLCDAEPQSIANRLIQLLGNPELCSKLGTNGYAVAQQHDWPKALESYAMSYSEFIK